VPCHPNALVRSLVRWFALLSLVPAQVAAQLEPPSTGGFAALDQDLRLLGHHQRVLMIAAHPDDEDTELLTVLVRGMGVEAGYLALNRGEGGQNLIGDELGEALGLLRTSELLAARRLDGAAQFFTRAYDFGFSKTLADTWAQWPRDSVLKDVVRVVRRFRPQVVVSIFSGTPRDGHGQHQAAGWAAKEAFRIAGDSTRFPELQREEGLSAWTPRKLYRSTRFDTAATTLRLDGGVLDPAVGQSYHQIAMRGRSLHRSQDMGQLQGIGPSLVRLQLLEDRTAGGQDALFAGVDTTLEGLWQTGAPQERSSYVQAIRRYRELIDSARSAPLEGSSLASLLLAARAELGKALSMRQTSVDRALDPLEQQGERLTDLIQRAEGLVTDALMDDERIVPGQRVTVTVSAWNAGPDTVEVQGFVRDRMLELAGPADSTVVLSPGEIGRWVYAGPVVAGPETSTPYFLQRPRAGDMYRWPGERHPDDATPDPQQSELVASPSGFGVAGSPFGPPLSATIRFRRAGSEAGWLLSRREIAWRTNDQARGEVRRPVVVVPRVDVRLVPENEVWRAGARIPQQFTVTLTHGARDTTQGAVTLELPPGWPPVPPQRFALTREDERREFRFAVRPPLLKAGRYELRAVATDASGAKYGLAVLQVDYPHIHPRSYTSAATASVQLAPLTLAPLARVGYVRGAADRVPEALQSVGVPLELLTGRDLVARPLARYDVIVIGPRAWETDPDLPVANDLLLAYARGGGTVVVQYQQYGYFLGGFAPFPLTVGTRAPGVANAATGVSQPSRPAGTSLALLGGHDRVTDETARVRIVDPASPVVRTPNRIGPSDWDGWTQERGLYFAHSWDPAWKPVLEMHDPGDSPLEGGLLVSRVGKGTYVYTGLAFFRQLPAGVPGAFRLFANLLALGRSSGR
jgi:LmbE family N-acetylglucosaminyl deacetylase